MIQHRFDVTLLAVGLGANRVPLGVNIDFVGVLLPLVMMHALQRLRYIIAAEPILAAELSLQLIQHRRRPGNLLFFAAEAKLIIACHDVHAQRFADHPQITVGRAEQGQLLLRLFQGNIEVHKLKLTTTTLNTVGIDTLSSQKRPIKSRDNAFHGRKL